MPNYDKKHVDEEFQRGLQLLNTGRYEQAIPIFTSLINLSETSLDEEDAKITYQTSLNNRGKAKCEIGRDKWDKNLFVDGLKDYEESVRASGEIEENKSSLTAERNLRIGREELKDFDQPRNSGFKNPFEISLKH